MKSSWTEERLQSLFDRYNRRFWRERLPKVRIRVRNLDGCYGQIEWKQREILIDIDSHSRDREIRDTVLHEMCHLATRKGGHGSSFWAEVEKLLRQGAPISVGCPETPRLKILDNVVPTRFPLAHRLMQKTEQKRARDVEKWTREKNVNTMTITDEDIAREFEEVGTYQGWKWRQVLSVLGSEYGLLNVDGKPRNQWAARLITKCRESHAQGKRRFLQYKRAKARDTHTS